MTHLLILCEGVTEKRVLKSFLRPYWQQRFQTVDVQSYDGNQELRVNFKIDVEQQLAQEPESCVLCLVDLHEEPSGLYRPGDMTIEEGYHLVQDYMYRQVQTRFHARFGAFPVVMETEAWLFADPVVQQYLGDPISAPETIKHPCNRLETIYKVRKSQYGKIVDGVQLFGKANAVRVYQDNCPHFIHLVNWIVNPPVQDTELENLAKAIEMWENERDEKYQRWQKLANEFTTDAELEEAIKAEQEYEAFLQTYPSIFK